MDQLGSHPSDKRCVQPNGDKIRELRIKKFGPRKKLTDKVDISPRTLADIENNKKTAVFPTTLHLLAESLEVTYDELLAPQSNSPLSPPVALRQTALILPLGSCIGSNARSIINWCEGVAGGCDNAIETCECVESSLNQLAEWCIVQTLNSVGITERYPCRRDASTLPLSFAVANGTVRIRIERQCGSILTATLTAFPTVRLEEQNFSTLVTVAGNGRVQKVRVELDLSLSDLLGIARDRLPQLGLQIGEVIAASLGECYRWLDVAVTKKTSSLWPSSLVGSLQYFENLIDTSQAQRPVGFFMWQQGAGGHYMIQEKAVESLANTLKTHTGAGGLSCFDVKARYFETYNAAETLFTYGSRATQINLADAKYYESGQHLAEMVIYGSNLAAGQIVCSDGEFTFEVTYALSDVPRLEKVVAGADKTQIKRMFRQLRKPLASFFQEKRSINSPLVV